MDASWMTTLATEGGAALAGAAATEAWQYARDGIRKLFNSTEGTGNAVDIRLNRTAEQIEAAGSRHEEERQRLSAQWEARLGDLLESHPEAADDLREWITGVRARLTGEEAAWINNRMEIHAGRDAYTAGRDQTIVQRVAPDRTETP